MTHKFSKRKLDRAFKRCSDISVTDNSLIEATTIRQITDFHTETVTRSVLPNPKRRKPAIPPLASLPLSRRNLASFLERICHYRYYFVITYKTQSQSCKILGSWAQIALHDTSIILQNLTRERTALQASWTFERHSLQDVPSLTRHMLQNTLQDITKYLARHYKDITNTPYKTPLARTHHTYKHAFLALTSTSYTRLPQNNAQNG